MLHIIRDFFEAKIEDDGTAVLFGEGGRLELALAGERSLSVFYVPDPSILSAEKARPFPSLFAGGAAPGAWGRWDKVEEGSGAFTLCRGQLVVSVEKETGTVSVFRGGALIHGGRIGDQDTVVPRYPLRIQRGQSPKTGRGKFNFRLEDGDAFFGLGEKTGGLDKRNRSFKLFNKDSLGYDPSSSDPLYKSVPFFIKANRGFATICGLFFPNLRVGEVDFGVESRFYYHVDLEDGPFGYFLMMGDSYREILRQYVDLVGHPALPPLFSFGYLASSMAYTDPDDAEAKILAFFEKVEASGIPCEGMYFSSGYAKADNGERYTFVWNRGKFPYPESFLGKLRERGYRVCCNVKPGILTSHPWYDRLARSGVFVLDGDGSSLVSYYWGNSASLVDFSRREGFDWWVEALTANIIDTGASGVWNDNNEFEIEDEELPIQACRSYLPVMMARASWEALRRARPGKRPWLISRAGYAGLQRYARTWTGDNVSDYKTLTLNIAMGMNLGLSGLPMYGHDLGGFYGDHPDEELLLRWCQSAIFQPRFVMHSWKANGKITEPWTFPEALSAVRRFIEERYRYLPYIYDLAIRAAETGVPLESPLALEFPHDPSLPYDCLHRMAGDAVLLPGPPERGSSTVRIHFPAGEAWYDPFSETLLEGGREAEFQYPPDGLLYFFRCGTVVPTSVKPGPVGDAPPNDFRFLLFPPQKGDGLTCFHNEDDGESDFTFNSHWRYRMEFRRSAEGVCRFSMAGERFAGMPFERTWRFWVPEGFVIETTDGKPARRGVEFRLGEAPASLEFLVRGEYARGARGCGE